MAATLAVLLLCGPVYHAIAGVVCARGKGDADVMSVMRHIRKHWRDGDVIYAHWGVHFELQYYFYWLTFIFVA